MFDQFTVDLRRQPSDRWHLTPTQQEQARELLAFYRSDLRLRPAIGEFLISTAKDVVRGEYWEEMESLAREARLPVSDVALCNCYYDLLKVALGQAFGCTAFAIDAPGGILHARNLDWWTENSGLARYTTVNRFVGARAGEFTTIGWPGFIGAFFAPGRFAVSLNAVLSLEPAQIATPVVFLLRSVLEEARSFDEARRLLSESPIPATACCC